MGIELNTFYGICEHAKRQHTLNEMHTLRQSKQEEFPLAFISIDVLHLKVEKSSTQLPSILRWN